jgi:hypothetical protein
MAPSEMFMYRETAIFIVPRSRHHDGPPSSPVCKKFYDRRREPLERVIAWLVATNDIEGIGHLRICSDCRLAIQMREIESSESYMDLQLEEAARKCMQQ